MNRLLNARQVAETVGLSRCTIYRSVKAGRFPRQVRLGPNRVAWRADEIAAWNDARPVATADNGAKAAK